MFSFRCAEWKFRNDDGGLRFILRAVAGACVGRRTGQARMPPVDRQHEGFRFLRRRERNNPPGTPMGRPARLAAEIPDISIPLRGMEIPE